MFHFIMVTALRRTDWTTSGDNSSNYLRGTRAKVEPVTPPTHVQTISLYGSSTRATVILNSEVISNAFL